MTIEENRGKLSGTWDSAQVDTDQGTIGPGDHSAVAQGRESDSHGWLFQSMSGQNSIFGVQPMQTRTHAGHQEMIAVKSQQCQPAWLGQRLPTQVLSTKRIALQPFGEAGEDHRFP